MMIYTNAETSASYSNVTRSTPSVGQMARVTLIGALLFVHPLLCPSATASTYRPLAQVERTAATPAGEIKLKQLRPIETPAVAVLEIRRLSGFTWDELADLFQVSRRSLHHWAGGAVVSSKHEQSIRQTLAVLRALSISESVRMRDFLLSSDGREESPVDLLKVGEFDEVLSRGDALVNSIARKPLTPLSRAAEAARQPAAPANLLGAIQDRPHISSNGRIARAVRVPKATG